MTSVPLIDDDLDAYAPEHHDKQEFATVLHRILLSEVPVLTRPAFPFSTAMSEEQSIDELLRALAQVILQEALDSENPQFRLDAFRAVQSYGKGNANKSAPAEPAGGMAAWGARLRQVQRAAEIEDGDDEAEADRA